MRITLGIAAAATTLMLLPAAPAAAQDRDWTWSGTVESGRTLFVRNLNGPVRVEPSTGSTVEVTAVKRARRRGNPDDVKITVEQRAKGADAVICAVWNDRTDCDESGYRTRNESRWWNWGDEDRGDVSVEFTVRVPKGVRITTSTVNGGVEIEGAESEVDAKSVNGSIRARSNGGPVRARTVNGSLDIRAGALGTGPVEYETVNGQITLEIPDNASADVELKTVNGGISTDFPLTVEGKFSNRRVRGSIGKGGQLIRLTTVNGSIRLRKA
jgi:DUF4097 and DUF4098 domain-containing protein YvlB